MFVRAILRMLWFIRLCHDSDSFAICTETVFKLFRFFLSALPIVFKADQLFSSAIPVSLKFSSLLLRFFRKFFTLSISFPMNEEIFSEVEFSFSTNPSAPLYQEYLFHVWAFCLFKICTCSFRKFLLLDFSLFNCDGWSVDRKEPFIQKRCTLYLPIILIGGPICRHMLLFYVKLCHRTHPFHSFKMLELFWSCPCRTRSPAGILLPLSFSAFCENRRHKPLTSDSGSLLSFSFPLSSFLTLAILYPGSFGMSSGFSKKFLFFLHSLYFFWQINKCTPTESWLSPLSFDTMGVLKGRMSFFPLFLD